MAQDTKNEGEVRSSSSAYDVDALVEGDRAAFEAMVREESERLFRVVMRLLHDEDEAEDIVQETFLQAYRSLDRFRGDSAFSTWLIGIGINLAKSRLRKKDRSGVLSEGDIDDLQPEFRFGFYKDSPSKWRPLDDVEQDQQYEVVHQAIDRLPDNYKAVIMLRDIEELSTKEAADALDLTPGNVRVRLHRARQALRAILEKYLEGDKL